MLNKSLTLSNSLPHSSLFFSLIFLSVITATDTSESPHTFHNVTVNNFAICQFSHLFEDNFYFVDIGTGQSVHRFALGIDEVFEYGLVITKGSTFNMLYSLTCTQNNNETAQSPKVAFVVGADGPAQPNINVVNYYGAKGNYVIVPGVGENYQVFFP
jgi:hypothetical protein